MKTEKGKSTHQLLRLIVIQWAVEMKDALNDGFAIERLDFGGYHSAESQSNARPLSLCSILQNPSSAEMALAKKKVKTGGPAS